MLEQYLRVTESLPCQLCHKPKWCLIHKTGTFGVCARVATPERIGNAGWKYPITGPLDLSLAESADDEYLDPSEVLRVHLRCRRALTRDRLTALASELSVDSWALDSLGVGFHEDMRAYSFPFRQHDGRIVGIQFRQGGRKWSLSGSRLGLFLPANVSSRSRQLLFCCEGASDTAALLSIGLFAIGRPATHVGGPMILDFMAANPRWVRGPSIVLVADSDPDNPSGNVGLEGARAIAHNIHHAAVLKPLLHKDARQAIINGCSVPDFEQALNRKPNDFWSLDQHANSKHGTSYDRFRPNPRVRCRVEPLPTRGHC